MTPTKHLRPLSAAAALVALLQACGTTPPDLPGRVDFPDGSTGTSAEVTETPETVARVEDLPDLIDADLFAATREALAQGDWMAATLALPQKQPLEGSPTETAPGDGSEVPLSAHEQAMDLWIAYYRARIAYLRGDLETHRRMLDNLREPLPQALSLELLQHRLALARIDDDAERELLLLWDLKQRGPGARLPDDTLNTDIWTAAQAATAGDTDRLRRLDNEELNGWLDLAAASRTDDARSAAAAMEYWIDDHRNHPAQVIAGDLLNGARRDSETTRLALLVPLSGPLQSAGDAVVQGFTAAFYDNPASGLELIVLDSRRFESPAGGYQAAQRQGAEVVIGPLGKLAVEELLREGKLDTPLVTLNRSDGISSASALELSMAPEDEAEQMADWAFAEGARRVLMIRPDSDWGRRMDGALRPRFQALGGRIPVTASYRNPSSYSDTLRDALGLGASAQRSSALRNLFEARLETEGRRRQDLDAIFLLCKSSEEARALKPLINYHFAGDLPVYAISSADTGRNDRTLNRDLGNLRMLALPWRLDEERVPGFDTTNGGTSLSALHALGADAFAVALRWWRMSGSAPVQFDGFTATLSRERQTLQRRLTLAEFDRGALRPR